MIKTNHPHLELNSTVTLDIKSSSTMLGHTASTCITNSAHYILEHVSKNYDLFITGTLKGSVWP